MITINTDAEGAYPNASDERLAFLVHRIGDDLEFVIVERDDAPGFAQAVRRQGTYTVEYQDPSGEQWQGCTEDAVVVRDVLVGWSRDHAGWHDRLAWTSIGSF